MLTLKKESHQPGQGVVAEKYKARSSSDSSPTALLIARFRLRGHNVERTAVGGFNVSFQGLLRHCSCSETLHEYSKKAGAKS